jgi:hypothetical protein
VKAFLDSKKTPVVEYAAWANYFWAIVHGLAILLIDGQIKTTGENYGLPTLLSDEKSNCKGDIYSMVTFSKDTVMNFWGVIFDGIALK